MAFEKLSNSIHELNENVKALAYSSAEYYKLDLYKKIVKGVIALVTILLIGFISLIAFLFLSIAIAMLISNALDQPSAGFFIVGGFYVLLLVLMLLFGKKYIQKIIILKSSRNFFND
ncbi:MAG: phage holin family protein [Gillisia sp.]